MSPTAQPEAQTSPALAAFVIVGFPKCGTSALARALEGLDGVSIDRWGGGQLEAPFFSSDAAIQRLQARRLASPLESGVVAGHKFTAYVYNPTALRRIGAQAPQAPVIVCVRDPRRALLSWHAMHRRIATDGKQPGHFVNESEESRRFYAEASVDAYYHRFARDRLDYADHVRRVARVLPEQQLVIVAQEFMSARMDRALAGIAGLIGVPPPAVAATPGQRHKGIADKADLGAIGAEVLAELSARAEALHTLVDELRRDPRVTLLTTLPPE